MATPARQPLHPASPKAPGGSPGSLRSHIRQSTDPPCSSTSSLSFSRLLVLLQGCRLLRAAICFWSLWLAKDFVEIQRRPVSDIRGKTGRRPTIAREARDSPRATTTHQAECSRGPTRVSFGRELLPACTTVHDRFVVCCLVVSSAASLVTVIARSNAGHYLATILSRYSVTPSSWLRRTSRSVEGCCLSIVVYISRHPRRTLCARPSSHLFCHLRRVRVPRRCVHAMHTRASHADVHREHRLAGVYAAA